MAKFVIKYRGVLTEMYVTGFSEPMDVGADAPERSVKASSRLMDAKRFESDEVEEAFEQARRCFQSAAKMEVKD